VLKLSPGSSSVCLEFCTVPSSKIEAAQSCGNWAGSWVKDPETAPAPQQQRLQGLPSCKTSGKRMEKREFIPRPHTEDDLVWTMLHVGQGCNTTSVSKHMEKGV